MTTPLVVVLLAAAPPGHADAPDFYGFLTQGYTHTDRNNYFGNSTGSGSLAFWELGVGASWQAADRLRLSTLLLAREAGATDTGRPRVDHALLDLSLAEARDASFGVAVGRYKVPFGLYNATRDVAATRPGVLLPQSIYFDNARKFLINRDGVNVYGKFHGEGHTTQITLQGTLDAPGIDNLETKAYLLGQIVPGSLSAQPGYGVSITHERSGGRTRLAAMYAHEVYEYRPAGMDLLAAGEIRTQPVWLSAYQEIGRWSFTTEAFLPRLEYRGFGPYLPNQAKYPLGWYAQVGFRPLARWEAFGRYDVTYLDRHDRNGEQLAAQTGRPAHNFYAKDWTAGARFHVTPRLSVSAEWHNVQGTAWLPIGDNSDLAASAKNWNLFASQITYSW